MRILFLTGLFQLVCIHLFAQQYKEASTADFITNVRDAASINPPFTRSTSATSRPSIKIPAGYLQQPVLLKQAISKLTTKSTAVKVTSNHSRYNTATRNIQTPTCQDTSFTQLKGITNGWLYIESVTQTADGNMLVPAIMYDSTRLPNPWSKLYGLLMKIDEMGNIRWLKQFNDLANPSYSNLIIYKVFELPGQDIICTGKLENTPSATFARTIVYRLNSAGNIIWQNSFTSSMSTVNAPAGFFTYTVESAAEGVGGDVILCGTTTTNLSSSAKFATVVRLNSTGQLVWDANYGNHGPDGSYRFGAEGVAVFMQGGQLIATALSHGSNNPETAPAIIFMHLNYNTGDAQTKRFFRADYTDNLEEFLKGFTYWVNNCVRLTNGHFLFYGKLFSDFVNMTPTKDHFGVVEFDGNFNLMTAYTISSALTTNYYNNVLHFGPSGKGVLSVFEYISSYEGNVFFGSFQNGQFLNQRKKHYTNTGMPGNNGFAILNDGGYVYLQTYFIDQPSTKSHFEFRKMHDSDTSSECLGKDTLLLGFQPLNIIEDPTYFFFDNNIPNKLSQNTENINQTDTTTTNQLAPCRQTNYCDTLKIHGNAVICGSLGYLDFTSFKNTGCGAIVQWAINPLAIDSFKVRSDSSVRIWFKNINWQGYLYASLPGGNCLAPVKDSMLVSIIRSQDPVNLGPDTTLCTNNTLILHAGSTYLTYLWQDGSTDSVLTVSTPGLYWVSATDVCGNSYRDTIQVNPLDVSFSLGPDRVKCNNDTLHLSGPPGYINYQWSPGYAISNTATQNVVVNPDTDTVYYLQAEKFSGCFARDTIRVSVNTSPSIELGPDKSFCQGDSLLLDAGPGFVQYNWSTGTQVQQLTVYNVGIYSISATTSQGCKSFDTLRVVNVFPTPIIMLNKDNYICENTVRVLQPGAFQSYLWHDGSTGPVFNVSGPGIYYLQVTDINQCTASDTVRITSIKPAPVNFLPQDTTICTRYGSVVIGSTRPFNSYQWNNGSTVPAIIVTAPGVYWLKVKDQYGCPGNDSITVKEKECLKGFYMPTAFTPDNNGKNDLLRPIIGGIVKEYRLTIYDRWGRLVFSSSNPTEGWDGRVMGILQDSFVYVWLCSYRLEGEQAQIAKGTVTLIR